MYYTPFTNLDLVMFLNHYFMSFIACLAFAVIMVGALAGWNHDGAHPWKFNTPASRNLYFGLLGLALIGFLYFLPLTYGVPLSPAGLSQHMWLPTWR
jgi:dolichyl-phosphate-mannose--protein O-mannosyl transferase